MADNFSNSEYTEYSGFDGKPKVQKVAEIYSSDIDEQEDYTPRNKVSSEKQRTARRPSSASSHSSAQRTARPSSQRSSQPRTSAQRNSASRPASGDGGGRTSVRSQSARPTARPAGTRGSAPVRRRKKNKFKKGLLAYVALLVLILIVGSIMFSTYLGAYENSRPYKEAESLTKTFTSSDSLTKLLQENTDKTDVIGDVSAAISSCVTNASGKQISYVQNSDFRTDAPCYNITADGKVIAKVTLEKGSDKGWGFSGWQVSRIAISEYLPDTTTYKIMVPQGGTVYLNGEQLDSSYIAETGAPKALKNIKQFLTTVPEYDTYSVSLVSEPTVTAKDASGTDLTMTQSDTTYAASSIDQTFIDSVSANVEATVEKFATYFIHMSYNLSAYLLPGTNYYIALFGDEDSYGIDTSLYNYEYISNYEFTTKEIKNYVKYSDECFSVDVKYHMQVDFSDEEFKDEDQDLDATWVFVYSNNDWYLADSQSH